MEKIIARGLNLEEWKVKNAISLLKENTIHFVARYRKDQTGGLNEITLREIEKKYKYLEKVEKLKKKILKTLEKERKLTTSLRKKIQNSYNLTELEDIYLPYKKRKKTKADIAIENGLLPLAEKACKNQKIDIKTHYTSLFNTKEKIIDGITDILAQKFAHNDIIRKKLELILLEHGHIKCQKKIKEKTKYDTYDKFERKIKHLKEHNILSINRGEKEGVLQVKLYINKKHQEYLYSLTKWEQNKIIRKGLEKGWKLLFPSIEKRVRNTLTKKAEDRAIKVFAENLKQLLLTKPLRNKRLIAIDPGNKTGCKIAILDEFGNLLDYAIIFPTSPHLDFENSEKKVLEFIEKYHLDLVVIGNGTASREVQKFIVSLIKKHKLDIKYTFSNEAGASVYSTSDIAIEEFPDLDPTIRSAVSIGRRIQDPMAELVKINPKSLGIGQYQHDVNQKKLDEELKNVVSDVVNLVGVDLNSASSKLLEYVSGITPSIAKKIIKYREKIGKFTERKQLLEIDGLGKKTYTQCAGFLRIKDGKNPLEATGIHPEHYNIAEEILKNQNIKEISEKYNIGNLTLDYILNELKNMGKDLRNSSHEAIFYDNIITFEMLKVGTILKGKVTNITDFGVFLDIGLKESGFIYKKLLNREMKINDIIKVEVIELDKELRHIKLKPV
ncbi:hypothetical protein XJ44_02450 [Thermosipho affectus]|uniref:S1 motif domain-containing protein n=1 Tax=Thermosipho affectus TaxID=660294 RepID=A0ABX3IM76_9BACT|nr:Tex-like N-terminal domain-containing protein [Thermosipho affectus]ONN27612.1 hypothetical protein XJ44_02450 [Thermosipho affectus]